jgi:hypothetical protein
VLACGIHLLRPAKIFKESLRRDNELCSEYSQIVFRIFTDCVQNIHRLCSEYSQIVFIIFADRVQNTHRLCSEYSQIVFRIFTDSSLTVGAAVMCRASTRHIPVFYIREAMGFCGFPQSTLTNNGTIS